MTKTQYRVGDARSLFPGPRRVPFRVQRARRKDLVWRVADQQGVGPYVIR